MKDNELYYLVIGAGAWHGRFSFEVKDTLGLLRADARAIDKLSAFALHGLLKVFSKATINSHIRGACGGRLARSSANVVATTIPILRMSPLRIYALRGYYRLDGDGRRAHVRMHEEFGPIPLLFRRDVRASAEIGPGGMSARYSLEMFGSPWTGDYTITPAKDHVDVRYTCPWGELRYDADREGFEPVVEPAPPPPDVERLLTIARRLEDKAADYHARDDLLAVFTSIYADITYALAETLAGDEISGVDGRSFGDRAWVVRLAEAFARRYFEAIDARNRGGYLPPWWRPVFEALRVRVMTELDAAALCIYAHVSGDLAHALAEVEPLAGDPGARLADYDLLNEVLAVRIDDVQHELADLHNGLYGWLDRLSGRLDEVFVEQHLRDLRAVAWYDAGRLLGRDPKARLRTEEAITRRVEDFVSDLLDPTTLPLAAAVAQLTRYLFAPRRTR